MNIYFTCLKSNELKENDSRGYETFKNQVIGLQEEVSKKRLNFLQTLKNKNLEILNKNYKFTQNYFTY